MSIKPDSPEVLQTCPDCKTDSMSRVHRKGFLQEQIYPHFGMYPWECWRCRVEFIIRKRGLIQRRRQAPLGSSLAI